MKKIVRRISGVLALMPVAIALFAVGLVLSLSQAYVAVAAELPAGLPGARLAAASTHGDLTVAADPWGATFLDLTPGDQRFWKLDASLLGADSGRLSMRVFGTGAVVEHPTYGLRIAVQGCEEPYAGGSTTIRPTCPAGATTIISQTALASISSAPSSATSPHSWVLPDIERGKDQYFLVTLGIPAAGASDKTLMGLRGNFGVGLYAAGDTPPVAPPTAPVGPASPPAPEIMGPLPNTGGPVLALILLGLGAVGLGLAARKAGTGESVVN